MTFSDELRVIRADYVASNQGRHELPLALSIIDRWLKRHDAEEIWETIRSRVRDASAKEFILGLLNHRIMLENVNRVVRDSPRLEAKLNNRTKRHLKNKDYAALAEDERLGLRTAHARHIEIRERLLGRKKAEAARKMFMAGCSAAFVQRCGQPLDEQVACLTEIAFGGEVTVDMVRGTSKPTRDR